MNLISDIIAFGSLLLGSRLRQAHLLTSLEFSTAHPRRNCLIGKVYTVIVDYSQPVASLPYLTFSPPIALHI